MTIGLAFRRVAAPLAMFVAAAGSTTPARADDPKAKPTSRQEQSVIHKAEKSAIEDLPPHHKNPLKMLIDACEEKNSKLDSSTEEKRFNLDLETIKKRLSKLDRDLDASGDSKFKERVPKAILGFLTKMVQKDLITGDELSEFLIYPEYHGLIGIISEHIAGHLEEEETEVRPRIEDALKTIRPRNSQSKTVAQGDSFKTVPK